ncbi:MAG: NAD(P)-dependent oxidoreductase [Terrimicrobiaceae bacterium]|nr:NAD(P)-dependent oxidoreductase [Terrimicrobiaceae bacterium]
MKMHALFVTGATGFVGRNLLLRAGRGRVPILAPVRNREKLFRCMDEDGVPREAVAPLPAEPAEWSAFRPSHAVLGAGVLFARSRAEYFATNVDWTLRALRALPPECRTVVLSSQSAGGPTPEGRAARSEQDPDSPVAWYGESKLELERAIAREFPGRPITILRPPMILGARDTATLPLFKMARGLVRTKPGFRRKEFSFLAVEDVAEAIYAAFEIDGRGPFYIGSDRPVSDFELISSAAQAVGGKGITLPVPMPVVRLLAACVDALPSLRATTPSLTKDRAKEIWPDRWVVDSSAFRQASGWSPSISLDEALLSACRHFQERGQLAAFRSQEP